MLKILKSLPATPEELRNNLGLTTSVNRWLRKLAGTGHVHISGRTREIINNGVRSSPIYSIGPNFDMSQLPKIPNWKTIAKIKQGVKIKSIKRSAFKPLPVRQLPKPDILNALFGRF